MKHSLEDIVAAYLAHDKNKHAAATFLGLARSTLRHHLKKAGEIGLLGTDPVIEGFRISQVSTTHNAAGDVTSKSIQQKPEHGAKWVMPEGQKLAGVSVLVNPDDETIVKWIKTKPEDVVENAWREALDEFLVKIPREDASPSPVFSNKHLLAQYTVTDVHFGMRAWAEETRDADYDLVIAEKLLTDWFTAAIDMAPAAHTAIFAQLGDLAHFDSMEALTPASKHVVDAAGRAQEMIRVIIRVVRKIIKMLLAKHAVVKIIMAKANHDPYSSAYLRESLAAMYEDEPRIIVETSPAEYYCHVHGKTVLFYHHGHKRQVDKLDTVFAGMFKSEYGMSDYAYGHCGHFHNDEVKETNLMRLERHRTLAPSDAHAASGGYLSKRDAKMIVYHDRFGEVSRQIGRASCRERVL